VKTTLTVLRLTELLAKTRTRKHISRIVSIVYISDDCCCDEEMETLRGNISYDFGRSSLFLQVPKSAKFASSRRRCLSRSGKKTGAIVAITPGHKRNSASKRVVAISLI